MRKPFTLIAAILLLLVAAAHIYRVYAGIPIVVGGQALSDMASYIIGGVIALVAVMTFVELKK